MFNSIDFPQIIFVYRMFQIILIQLICLEYACKSDEFRCTNHKCVHKTLKCNGQNDCGDNSDETKDCIGI